MILVDEILIVTVTLTFIKFLQNIFNSQVIAGQNEHLGKQIVLRELQIAQSEL